MSETLVNPEVYSIDRALALRERDPAIDRLTSYLQFIVEFAGGGVATELEHSFTPGLASRTYKVPAGSVVVTRIHRTKHQFMLAAGRVRVWTPGGEVTELVAPFHGITEPGTQRVVLVLEDCWWTTFHPTHTTDISDLEVELAVIPPGLPELSDCELLEMDRKFSCILEQMSLKPATNPKEIA